MVSDPAAAASRDRGCVTNTEYNAKKRRLKKSSRAIINVVQDQSDRNMDNTKSSDSFKLVQLDGSNSADNYQDFSTSKKPSTIQPQACSDSNVSWSEDLFLERLAVVFQDPDLFKDMDKKSTHRVEEPDLEDNVTFAQESIKLRKWRKSK